MSQGPDSTNGWGQLPAASPGYSTGPPYTVAQPAWDPVTGQSLPPGPAAYSAVDPYASAPNGPPAYPTIQGPTGYPPGYPGYPAPQGYPGYPAPPGYQLVPTNQLAPTPPSKPGGAVAAAVLAFVQSALVLMGGFVLLAGGSQDTFGLVGGGELTAAGYVALIAGGLLIAGGTAMLGRRPTLLTLGAALSIAVSIYFVVRLADVTYGSAIWAPIVFAVLPVIAVALSMSRDVRAWVRAGNSDAR